MVPEAEKTEDIELDLYNEPLTMVVIGWVLTNSSLLYSVREAANVKNNAYAAAAARSLVHTQLNLGIESRGNRPFVESYIVASLDSVDWIAVLNATKDTEQSENSLDDHPF